MKEKYWALADHLSDHLWMTNNLDLDLLKQFPEFIYEGEGYRVLFLDKKEDLDVSGFTGKSFSTSKEGLDLYIENVEDYNRDVQEGKVRLFFKAEIIGFDIRKALTFFKDNEGLTEKTIAAFIDEDEVISFEVSNLTQY